MYATSKVLRNISDALPRVSNKIFSPVTSGAHNVFVFNQISWTTWEFIRYSTVLYKRVSKLENETYIFSSICSVRLLISLVYHRFLTKFKSLYTHLVGFGKKDREINANYRYNITLCLLLSLFRKP